MHYAKKARIIEILKRCTTLSDADRALTSLAIPHSQRWGIWDGWTQRTHTYAGFEEPHHRSHYDKGYELGQILRRSNGAA